MCPKCGRYESIISNTRKKDEAVYRVRDCKNCQQRYGTIEIVNMDYKPNKQRKKVRRNGQN